jgi:hypothetical protein
MKCRITVSPLKVTIGAVVSTIIWTVPVVFSPPGVMISTEMSPVVTPLHVTFPHVDCVGVQVNGGILISTPFLTGSQVIAIFPLVGIGVAIHVSCIRSWLF